MNLKDKINSDLKTAMKSKDAISLRGIRAIKAAILLADTDGSGKELDEAGEIKLLQKLVKQRQDSLDIYTKQGREDLAKVEAEEIEVISRYLPEQLSEDELKSIVQEVIDQTQAQSMKDMGKVMGVVSGKVQGRADGRQVASIVKELLNT